MIKFLIKGLLRDRSRSLFPVLIVVAGVALTVVLSCWLNGVENEMISVNANFDTGHVKVMSQAYAEQSDQIPNDLALIGIDSLILQLRHDFPAMIWTPRIRFGGLLDIPDENGETRDQGPVFGIAVDLFNPGSPEKEILNLDQAIVRGRLPQKPGEILISDRFAQKLNLGLGETATLISSTMYGSMAVQNFTVVGTVQFGVTVMDRGAIIADIDDIQFALDMPDAAGEILGYFNDFIYRDEAAVRVVADFNDRFADKDDEFSPVMITLKNQNELASYIDIVSSFTGVIIGIFLFVMSIVLWNAGLMGSLRRYGEIGLRLAIGEDKGHVYRSLVVESLVIGLVGSILGTIVGLAFSYYLQVKGVNIGSMMKNATILMSDVMRARVTLTSYFIGFIPGLLATLLGTSIAGIGIYKRQTSQLFKELEV